jgi:acetyl-CoA carboxylase carboxyl transferase subunit beta
MAAEGWFRKRSKFSTAAAEQAASAIPDGVATKCSRCGQILFTRDFEKNLKVCTHCGFHHRLTADERIAYTVDEDTFVGVDDDLRSVDILQFPDYTEKLDKGVRTTGMNDGTRIGTATVRGVPCVLIVMDFRFMGGSLGAVCGEKIVRAFEIADDLRRPVVMFTSSGGARMFEGLLSLMQMAKTSAAIAAFASRSLPFLVVMADPTTGGVLASYASLGDVILAEPEALIAFAGARVAAQATNQKTPDDYQTAEWQLGRGQIDQVVHRRDVPDAIASILMLLGCRVVEAVAPDADVADAPVEVAVG